LDDSQEKRKHPRFEVSWHVTVFTDQGIIEGETINISVDGISICCEEPLQMEKIFRITIAPQNHKIIQVAGKVIWADLYGIDRKNTTIGMGICFVEVSDEGRITINDLISSLTSQK